MLMVAPWVFALKAPTLKTLTETSAISQIVPELTPEPGELVVRKQGFRKTAFILTAALLSAQIALVEGARILLWSGGLS